MDTQIEELKVSTRMPTVEEVQADLRNGYDVSLDDDDYVISNIGYVVKFV